MIETQFTSFHIDFSTLDIEKGQVSLMPSSFAMVMQPHIRSGGVVLRVEEEMESAHPREKMLPGATPSASKKRAKSR